MKEFPDDELDKLFRKSAEELDSNFDPQDWNALKNRLDENDGKTPGGWFKKWWPAGMLALLMLAGLTTYLLSNEERNAEKSVVRKENQFPESGVLTENQNKQPAEKAGSVSDDTKLAESGNSSEKDGNNTFESKSDKNLSITGKELKAKTDYSQGEKVTATRTEIAKTDKLKDSENKTLKLSTKSEYKVSKSENRKTLPRRWSKTGGVYLAPNHSIGRRGDGASLSENADNQNINGVANLDVAKARPEKLPPVISNTVENGNSGNVKNSFSIVDSKQKVVSEDVDNSEITRLSISANALKSRSLVWKKSNSLPKIEVKEAEIPPVSEPVKEVSEKEPTPKFAVRFSYSPDISSVGLKNLTKPGTAVSLLVEYALWSKLYIQSGVARSSKVYKAEGGEYVWPSSWDDQTVRPYSTDATCKVIEIPLNLRYDITNGARSRWFVGAGVSSYYMQNEKYIYNYKPGATGVKWPDWDGSTGWYWLSHINASAGYEYRFSKKLSLLAEPYVRIPVKKVGFGKVDLFTTGVWFSIRYTPIFKK
ncbi:hypothetical protein ACFP1I_25185 [Dyadobacter subterraneus]|uniref:Outer membrane protein beta-barrel domain-containing protein n=1 Tax=Dyadobacter subterraneus TaxID=2773304 RepID=A0ABR9WL62_9BACT|nr:hypothetical protein [Dyadobacter subterraneus]MBE9466258.1 hypothetical protein [Dyadobacter subterraneus]